MSTSPDKSKQRSRELAAIHIQATKLGMDEDAYRAFLERVAGKRSAAELDPKQRRQVLAELDRLAGRTQDLRDPRRGRPQNMDELPGYITKIEAQLADMKLPWSYADAIVKRQFGIERVSWCRKPEQLKALLAALHVEQIKRRSLAFVEACLIELTMTEADLLKALPGLARARNWKRDRKLLKAVGDHLETLMLESGRFVERPADAQEAPTA